MDTTTVAVDLAKSVFQLAVADAVCVSEQDRLTAPNPSVGLFSDAPEELAARSRFMVFSASVRCRTDAVR
jgi:hypothetical protein